jgi:cytosine/uracil/thiamine/allantoin permease
MMSPVARAGETKIGTSGGATSSTGGGKRAGSRRGPRRKRRFSRPLFLIALAVTGCVVAWGYLVVAAVDFGRSARGGEAAAWWFLGLATLGAVACLFVGLMLVARALRLLGITRGPVVSGNAVEPGAAPRPVGGRRAAR